jgi:hypothetical protein
MIKNIITWVMIIPIKIAEWVIWPITKVHELLKRLSNWLQEKLS